MKRRRPKQERMNTPFSFAQYIYDALMVVNSPKKYSEQITMEVQGLSLVITCQTKTMILQIQDSILFHQILEKVE